MFNTNIIEISSQKDFENLAKKEIVIVDCFAEWCMPCVMMAPVIEDIAERFKESMTFARVNIDDNSEIVERFKISSVPTLLILQNGKEIGRIIGNLPQTFLEEKIEKVLSTIISVQRI